MITTIKDNSNSVKTKEIMRNDVYEYNHNKCPECGSTNIFRDDQRAENICLKCGFVIEESIMDLGRDWVAYDNQQLVNRARTGAPITHTVHDNGLTTVMDKGNRDARGNNIKNNHKKWGRLRRWNSISRIANPKERNLAFALSQLDRYSSNLDLPKSIRENAALIYRGAVDKKLIRGRSIEGVVAASLYAACRQSNIPRTLDEISEVAPVSKKELGRIYRFLSRELQFKLSPTSPKDYVPRFASKAGLSGEVEAKAIEMINKARDKQITSGKGPTGIAAAALYISSILLGERKTQKEIAEVSGVTEVTIRNRYTELVEILEMGVVL